VNVAQRWLQEAHGLADQDCEKRTYAKFLKSYWQAETGKRAKKRNQRGCLTKDWKPEELYSKTVLVIGEDRIGDEVLTVACVPNVLCRCGAVSWKCDQKLKALFTRSFAGVTLISDQDPRPKSDGTIYSWELIGRFRKQLGDFQWVKDGLDFAPYLKPSTQLRDSLSKRYRDGSKKVVGLAWRSERDGEPLDDKTCDLREVPHWAAFFGELKDQVRFISLQYGNTQDEITFARWKYGVEIYQDNSIDIFDNIDAAAAQISTIDYVVSISTTAAHLAGALGVPGWVLLQEKPFGHWRAGQSLCPWYPTLRPIRQNKKGCWKSVLDEVTGALQAELHG
jgi:hypothetical protein